jgi:hypothetical protein
MRLIEIDEEREGDSRMVNQKRIFLEKEYEITWKDLHFIHEDRTRYVTVFISLLAGTGYAFFRAVDAHIWAISICISILSGFLNFFFLRWLIYHRVSALTYFDYLNEMRNMLCDLSVDDPNERIKIKNMILITKKTDHENPPYSREYEFYRIIALLTAINFFAAAYILFFKLIPIHIDCWGGYLIIGISIVLGILWLLFLNKWFESRIKKGLRIKDKEAGPP